MVYLEQSVIPTTVWEDGGLVFFYSPIIGAFPEGERRHYIVNVGLDLSDVLPPDVVNGTVELMPGVYKVKYWPNDNELLLGAPTFMWERGRLSTCVVVRNNNHRSGDAETLFKLWYSMFDPYYNGDVDFLENNRMRDEAVVVLTLVVVFGWFTMTEGQAYELVNSALYTYLLKGRVLSSTHMVMQGTLATGWREIEKPKHVRGNGENTFQALVHQLHRYSGLSGNTLRNYLSRAELISVPESALTAITLCDTICERAGITGIDCFINVEYVLAPTLSKIIGIRTLPKTVYLTYNGENQWTTTDTRVMYIVEGIIMRSYKTTRGYDGNVTIHSRKFTEEGVQRNPTGASVIEGSVRIVDLCPTSAQASRNSGSYDRELHMLDPRMAFFNCEESPRVRGIIELMYNKGVPKYIATIAATTLKDLDMTSLVETIEHLSLFTEPSGPPNAYDLVNTTLLFFMGYQTQPQAGVRPLTSVREATGVTGKVSLVGGAQYLGVPSYADHSPGGATIITIKIPGRLIRYRCRERDGVRGMLECEVWLDRDGGEGPPVIGEVVARNESYRLENIEDAWSTGST
jgi:hypothetical protein